jgi:hypothetical protein
MAVLKNYAKDEQGVGRELDCGLREHMGIALSSSLCSFAAIVGPAMQQWFSGFNLTLPNFCSSILQHCRMALAGGDGMLTFPKVHNGIIGRFHFATKPTTGFYDLHVYSNQQGAAYRSPSVCFVFAPFVGAFAS